MSSVEESRLRVKMLEGLDKNSDFEVFLCLGIWLPESSKAVA